MSVTAFPLMSVGAMLTEPVAVASSDTSSFPSPPPSGASLASARFRLEEREEELALTLETDTCADGLGDSFSLGGGGQAGQWDPLHQAAAPPAPAAHLCSSPSSSFR